MWTMEGIEKRSPFFFPPLFFLSSPLMVFSFSFPPTPPYSFSFSLNPYQSILVPLIIIRLSVLLSFLVSIIHVKDIYPSILNLPPPIIPPPLLSLFPPVSGLGSKVSAFYRCVKCFCFTKKTRVLF